MTTNEFFQWLKNNEQRLLLIALNYEKGKLIFRLKGYEVSLITNQLTIHQTSGSASFNAEITDDMIFENVPRGYRVIDNKYIYTFQII